MIDKDEIKRYIEPDKISFRKLTEAAASWSKGEKAMIQVAWELFNGGPDQGEKWGIHSIFGTLGTPWDQVALNAIRMRYRIY